MRAGHLLFTSGLLFLGFVSSTFAQTCPAKTAWDASKSLCVCVPGQFQFGGKCITPVGGFGQSDANVVGYKSGGVTTYGTKQALQSQKPPSATWVYLYDENPDCVAVDANPVNSCASRNYQSSQQSFDKNAAAADIVAKLSEGGVTLPSGTQTKLVTLLDEYSTKLCAGGKVKYRVGDFLVGDMQPGSTGVFQSGYDQTNGFKTFIQKLKNERGSSAFSTLITASVATANSRADTHNSRFLTPSTGSTYTDFLNPSRTDLVELPSHLGYCPLGMLDAKVKDSSMLIATKLLNVLKDDSNYKINCGGEAAFTNQLECSAKKKIFPKYGFWVWTAQGRAKECVAGGSTSLEDNQSDLVDSSSQFIATIQNCVLNSSGLTLDTVQITSSSSRLNNTAQAAALYCKKGFAALSKARADSAKTVVGSAFSGVRFPDPPGPATGGTNGDGTSGICPYERDAQLSTAAVFFEKKRSQLPDMKAYKFVKAVGTLVQNSAVRGHDNAYLAAARPCRTIRLACDWAPLSGN